MPTKVTDPALLAELNGAAAPQAPGVIYGRPKAADPTKEAERNRDIYEDDRDFSDKQGEQAFGNEQSLRKEFYGLPAVKEYQVAARTYANSLKAADDASGDQSLITAYAKMLDPGSVVREGEAAAVAGTDSTIGRTIATLAKEFGWKEGGSLSPAIRAKIRREMRTLADNYGAAYDQERGQFEGYATSHGITPANVVGSHLFDPYRNDVEAYWAAQEKPAQPRGEPSATGVSLGGGEADDGNDPPPGQVLRGYGKNEDGTRYPIYGEPTGGNTFGPAGELLDQAATLGKQGISLGLSDEAAGVGGAISSFLRGEEVSTGYTNARDEERARIASARDRFGYAALPFELASGGAGILARSGATIAAGRRAAAAGNLSREGVQRELVRSATRTGAALGGVGGFGYGEGAAGSTINALGGIALGGVTGNVGQRVGNAFSNRNALSGFDVNRAREVAQAGREEGVTVNRAMIDPRMEPSISGVDTTRQGPRLRAGMDAIEGQIEARAVAQGGTRSSADRESIGALVQDGLDTYREASRVNRNRLYDRAHTAAGNVRITPTNAERAASEQIAELRASGENANRGQIAYLEDILEDLGRPRGLTVQALRDQRTAMRGQINERNLTATDAERRVGIVLDAASQDIRQGLAGNRRALAMFDRADQAHGQRADFIRQVMQKLTGPENNRVSGTATASKLESWMKADPVRFRRLWNELADTDRDELRSFVVTSLGRDGNGEFSAQRLYSAVSGDKRQISDRALRTVFGDDGFRSIQNLRTISQEVGRVKSNYNHSRTERGRDFKSWLGNTFMGLLSGGGLGVLTGGGSLGVAATAAGGAAAGLGAGAVRNELSARALLSPQITRWIATAPRTTSPAAINRHLAKFGDIAKAEPALAGDVEVLRKAIMGAANDNAALGLPLAAEDQDTKEGR